MLAHHFGRTADSARAIRYLTLAGEKSLRLFTLDEADARFRRAVDLIEGAPGSVDDAALAEALLGWVRVHYYRKDFREIVALLERSLPRIQALGQARGHALLLFWLGFSHAVALRVAQAMPLSARRSRARLETAIGIARRADMPLILARGLLDLGLLEAAKKRRAEACAALEEALPIAGTLGSPPLVERIRRALAALS